MQREAFGKEHHARILRLGIHFEHGQHIQQAGKGEHTMVGEREGGPTLCPPSVPTVRRFVYDFLPAAPKRDNVINIVDVVRSSVLFCRRNAAKSRFFSKGRSNPDPFLYPRFSGAFLIRRRIFPDQKAEEFSPNSRHNGGFKTRIPRRLWNLTENGTFGDI